jgi:hypothetical protein
MSKFFIISLLCYLSFYNLGWSQLGCTDTIAKNYNPSTPKNDGNYNYKKQKIKRFTSVILSETLRETSGLVEWENQLYTYNDNHDLHLYQLDKKGVILKSIKLNGIQNKDWEAIAQDETHFYLGDIGNNVSGNRTDLCIYKIEKKSLFDNPIIEKIAFSYANQTDFREQKKNKTNFDGEAIVVTQDAIFIFTKQWKSKKSAVYRLPKIAGTHQAGLITTLSVKGLITGATFVANQNLIVLCGYSKKLQPFLYFVSNFTDFTFQNADQQKIKLKLPFHQIEGVSTTNCKDFYLTNEKISHRLIGTIPAQLHYFSLEQN